MALIIFNKKLLSFDSSRLCLSWDEKREVRSVTVGAWDLEENVGVGG